MTSPTRHLVDLLAYASTRSGHDRRDRAVVDDLTIDPSGWNVPDGLDVTWLGVAGFALSSQGTTVLIDPYVSRVSVGDSLRRRRALPDPTLLDRWVPRADAVLLGHTHFDHSVDAPGVARRDGATVYGGTSAEHLMRLHGLGDQACRVEPHREYRIGPFAVTFVPSRHSRLLLGRSVPNGGEITCEHVGALNPQAYRCGDVWGIHVRVELATGPYTIYHQGSADLIEDEIRHRGVNLFLCGIAGRQFTEDYTRRILERIAPEQVVVSHHDDFFVPLGEQPAFAFGVDVERFPSEVAAVSREIQVVSPPPPVPAAQWSAGGEGTPSGGG